MAADYTVTQTQPWTYQNPQGQLVEGYKIWFFLPAFGETHFLFMPNLNPDVVKKAIVEFVAQRKSLSTF
jgi:hypothetical protein